MMRVVGIAQPSPKKRNRHLLYMAMLHEIDLEECIEFVNAPAGKRHLLKIIERAHNEWDHTADVPERPLFKLIVVNQTDVVFVYHHMMADGLSGYVFHREFLAALNGPAAAADSKPSYIVRSDPLGAKIPLEWSQMPNSTKSADKRWHPSTTNIILSQCIFLVAQILMPSRSLFAKLPSSKPHLKSVSEIAGKPAKVVTRVVSSRLTGRQMARILSACRANGTTFTPLLITVLLVTLSTEYNRDAKIGSTRFALDMRPHLPVSLRQVGGGTENGTMFNCTSGMARCSRLGRYRDMLEGLGSGEFELEKTDNETTKDRIWDMTRRYKQWMSDSTIPAVRAVRSSRGIRSDLEHILNRVMPFAGTVLTNTTLVSNLGAFAPGCAEATGDGATRWRIVDVHFSAGATNGRQGSQGPIFNVAGLKGGATNINAVFEDGIISREDVQRILDTAVARMVTMAL